MAVKDHSLDEKIITASREEFMTYGFQKASLRKIAERAGITTGALYTRYKNKDVLFGSLIRTAFEEMGKNFEPLKNNYLKFKDAPCVENMMDAVRKEEEIYLDIMFRYYDECVLFFCKSDGSLVQATLQKMMAQKAKETVAFLRSVSKKNFDPEGVEFILSMQFYYYRQVLEKGYDKEKAVSCMQTVENFLEAGWNDLFKKIL